MSELDIPTRSQERFALLQDIVRSMGSVLVAFSGGVDSTFLLKVAVDTLQEKALAVLAESPTLPAHDRADALGYD